MITDIVTDSENREVSGRGLNNRIGCGIGGTAESTGKSQGAAGTLAGERLNLTIVRQALAQRTLIKYTG